MVMFTLAIPTKDRAELALETYNNIILSDYNNYEILVIDNDENEKTSSLFQKINNERLRIIRTGGLSMPDNWEQAFIHARGDYILVLGNKYRITPNFLREVALYIEKNSPSVICAELSFFKFPNQFKFDRNGWAVISSQIALDAISQLDFQTFFSIAPFGYKAIISMQFIRETQAKYGRFAFPVAPDFSMGYLSLLLNSEYHAYNKNCISITDNAPSNGLSDNYDGPLIREFRSSLGLNRSLAEYSPIPEIQHGYNLLVSDFFYISKLLGKKYPPEWMNSKKYFIEIFKSLMIRHLMFHLDVTKELKLLYAFAENKNIMWSREVMEIIDEYNHRYIKTQINSISSVAGILLNVQEKINKIRNVFARFKSSIKS